MDKLVRLFLRIGAMLEPTATPQLRPIPVPVRNQPPRLPGAPR